MKAISLHVSEEAYARIREIAASEGCSAAELIREAMQHYLDSRGSDRSLRDLPKHECGGARADWTRSEAWDEMIGDS